ncbi:hypothetical protein JCM10908_002286 [Rhodotorula pacifica]|uniref:NudC domain-containing protein n=1 Tax=Rhodotorula pacifica TaxID=1495444 RepID=UPI003172139A
MPPSEPLPADTLSFPTDHKLLNNRFESYKLAPLPRGDDAVISTRLPTPFALSESASHARLSYQQVADRARHNHLSAGADGELLYIDGRGFITAVEVDPTTAALTLHPLLSVPLGPDDVDSDSEYPDARPLFRRMWLISDGRGRLYRLDLQKATTPWQATLQPLHHVEDDQENLVPLRLLAVQPQTESAGDATVLYSTSSRSASGSLNTVAEAPPIASSSDTRVPYRSKTTFRLHLARIDVTATANISSVPLRPIWSATSAELPAFVHYDADSQRFAIGSGSQVKFATGGQGIAVEEAESSSTRSLDIADTSTMQSDSLAEPVRKPPPFSWTQEREAVTVAFPIPADTPTSSIRLTLSRQFVTLHIVSAAGALSPATSTSSSDVTPRLSHKKLWDAIDPNTSVWTFDREAEGRNSTFGLLTLHLEKANPGTRWSDVFETVHRGGDPSSSSRFEELSPEEDYENIPETLDASDLAAISERMEQWSQSILQGGGGSALAHSAEGLGSGIPTSLTGDEIDVEVDADAGRPFIVTWIENALSATPRTVCPHASVPYSLLSTPFPAQDESTVSTIAVQHDVDGLVFETPTMAAEYRWRHSLTFPALAFVLATKRDTRFVHHLDHRACLAFDSPALLPGPARSRPVGSAGNAFIYVRPEDPKAKQGIQHVVKVGSPACGGLLGVVATRLSSGEPVVVALCEHELVTLRIFS